MRSSTLWMFAFWLCIIADLFLAGPVDVPQPGGMYEVAFLIVSVCLLFGWFLADAKAINVRPSPMLKAGVVLLSMIAVPYYLLRYKGWKRALLSFGIFAAFMLVYLLIALLISVQISP